MLNSCIQIESSLQVGKVDIKILETKGEKDVYQTFTTQPSYQTTNRSWSHFTQPPTIPHHRKSFLGGFPLHPTTWSCLLGVFFAAPEKNLPTIDVFFSDNQTYQSLEIPKHPVPARIWSTLHSSPFGGSISPVNQWLVGLTLEVYYSMHIAYSKWWFAGRQNLG